MVQIHREDTNDTAEKFRLRFPVGTLLALVTTAEITVVESDVYDPFGICTDEDE